MRRILDRQCLEHQCPMIIIDDLGYDIVSCLVDWVEALIARAVLCDVIPGGHDGVQLIFSNGVALPLLSSTAGRVAYITDANELLENVVGARFERLVYESTERQTALMITFRKPNGDALIVETHPQSAVQMETPRVMTGNKFNGIV